MDICSASDGIVYKREGNGSYRGGCALSAYRGELLLWHRLSVSAVRVLSGVGQTPYVGGAYRIVSRYARSFGVPAVGRSRNWSDGDMVVGANRLASRRRGGYSLLCNRKEKSVIL